jgi:PEP-CTERM motif
MQIEHSVGVLLLLSLAAICATRSAKADTINVFTISGTGYTSCRYDTGTAEPIPGCTPTDEGFAGALEVDATSGLPISMDVLIPGVANFTNIFPDNTQIGPFLNENDCLEQPSPLFEELILCIATPTPGSLLGFDGSTIIGWGPAGSSVTESNGYQLFYVVGGSITPVAVATPEPSSLMLLLLGLVGLTFVAIRRRIAPRLPAAVA